MKWDNGRRHKHDKYEDLIDGIHECEESIKNLQAREKKKNNLQVAAKTDTTPFSNSISNAYVEVVTDFSAAKYQQFDITLVECDTTIRSSS
jgi:hypothetical protein